MMEVKEIPWDFMQDLDGVFLNADDAEHCQCKVKFYKDLELMDPILSRKRPAVINLNHKRTSENVYDKYGKQAAGLIVECRWVDKQVEPEAPKKTVKTKEDDEEVKGKKDDKAKDDEKKKSK